MERKKDMLNGMFGLLVGSAVGVPVKGLDREAIAARPRGKVVGMEAYGQLQLPSGSWSAAGSMALATLDSLYTHGKVCREDIMNRFSDWIVYGKYTPDGRVLAVGETCSDAIFRYTLEGDVATCGRTAEYANSNDALMRILPVCVHLAGNPVEEAVAQVEQIAALTYNHRRNTIACGIYFFLVNELVQNQGHDKISFADRIQSGIDKAFQYYRKREDIGLELEYFDELLDIRRFSEYAEEEIRASGYVVASLLASVWCCITTSTYEECILQAVNLGDDADATAAIAGGLAGLYYGIQRIPISWINRLRGMDEILEIFYV